MKNFTMKTSVIQKLFISLLFLTPFATAQVAPTTQGFTDTENLPGWIISNQSSPLGDSSWFQGTDQAAIFIAQDGEPNSYIAANHRNTRSLSGTPGTICNYLIMPELGNLESVSFYTRSRIANNNFTVFPDRLYMVYSPTGEINTGNCTDGFGDFTETLLVINPDLSQSTDETIGYPLVNWTQYSADINGNGRVAFVYYVEDAGFYGNNSNYIGIDSVEWVLAPLPPNQINLNPWK